jgi:hypothetical protein
MTADLRLLLDGCIGFRELNGKVAQVRHLNEQL